MRIYTRTGDAGQTGRPDGTRVPKSDARVMACGAVDEANAAIGVAVAHGVGGRLREMLAAVQADLLSVGADLADARGTGGVRVSAAMVARVESFIDELDAGLEELTSFVLPGGTAAGAHLHHARTVMRRAEAMASALGQGAVRPECAAYLNRASDLLFVMARSANAEGGMAEPTWCGGDTL